MQAAQFHIRMLLGLQQLQTDGRDHQREKEAMGKPLSNPDGSAGEPTGEQCGSCVGIVMSWGVAAPLRHEATHSTPSTLCATWSGEHGGAARTVETMHACAGEQASLATMVPLLKELDVERHCRGPVVPTSRNHSGDVPDMWWHGASTCHWVEQDR